MQGSGEKLTIAEFAARAGCTTQRVSQLLRKSLKQFQVIENGRKYILSDGLQVVLEAREKQGYRKSFETVSETLTNSCETVSSPELQAEIDELTAELSETRAELDAARDQLNRQANELTRAKADLEAAREQRQKAEIRAAGAEAAADAERKRADAAEQQCRVKDDQAAQQAKTVAALTASLQTAQEHAKELNAALTAAQALHAGTIQKQLETKDGEPDIPVDQQPKKKRGLFGGFFHREKKEGVSQ